MAQTIKLKRSAVQGVIPTTSQLELGEVAINTYDGKMYIKKNVGGTESIVEVGSTATFLPAGSDGQLQFNNGGALGATAQVYYDDVNNRLGIGTSTPVSTLHVDGTTTLSSNLNFLSPDTTNTISVSMLDTDTLSFSGDSGQLFSITDSLSGTIFAVNDISGVPSIEVDDDGTIRLAETFGNVLIGTDVDDGVNKLQLDGKFSFLLDTSAGNRYFKSYGSSGVRLQRAGDTIGWAFAYGFLSNNGADHGGFGGFGDDTSLTYYYIGTNYSDSSNFRFYKNGSLRIGSTEILDTSRNLLNIGTITATGGTMTGNLVLNADLVFGNSRIYASGDNNHIHVNCPTALIPEGITTSSNTGLGTSSYRWKDFYSGPIDVGNITTSGYLRGPANFVIDPAAHGDDTGTVVIAGNLQVDGTTTTINSTTVQVDDKNIELAVGSLNKAAADGAGITIDCGTDADATIIYDGIVDQWELNKDVQITGTVFANYPNGNGNSLLIGRSDTASYWNFNHAGGDLRIYNSAGTGSDILLGVDPAGTAIDNKVGIGTASPQTKLHVEGLTRISEGGNTAFYSGNYVRLFTSQAFEFRNSGGSVVAQINLSGNSYFNGGNVGIGTTAPDYDFTLHGTAKIAPISYAANQNNYAIRFGATNSTGWDNMGIKVRSDSSGIPYTVHTTGGGEETLYLNSGRVGINTTPHSGTKLQVCGSDTTPTLNTATITDCALILSNSDNQYGTVFATDSSGKGFIQQRRTGIATYYDLLIQPYGGNVGIGTTNPIQPLQVTGNVYSNNGDFLVDNGRGISSVNSLILEADENNSDADSYMAFRVDGAEAARITADKSFSIGSTTAFTTGGTAKTTILSSSVALSFGASNTDMSYIRRQNSGEYCWQTFNGGNSGNIELQPYGGSVSIGTTINAGRLHIVGAASDQTASPDSPTLPDTSTLAAVVIDGSYTDGKYRTRFAKIDRSGNLPLYIQESRGTANSYLNVARFGSFGQSVHEFQVFGSARAEYFSTGGGTVISLDNEAWTYRPHDIVYNGWRASTGDYTYLKAAGNSDSGHGIAVVADNAFYVGVTDQETGALADNATNPITTTWAKISSEGIQTNGNINVNSTFVFEGSEATLATTTQTQIASFSATTYGGGKFVITAKDGVNRHICELLVVHDGTTASATQYGSIFTSGELATYDVDISGGNVRILATSASANSTEYKVAETLMEA